MRPGLCFLTALLAFFAAPFIAAQSQGAAQADSLRRDVIRFGTETEIAALLTELRAEGAEEFDAEIIALASGTTNHRILTVAFNFFAERERAGLEARALRALEDRLDEHSETVLAAIDYLGRVGEREAMLELRALVDSGERRFSLNAIRALGRIGGVSGGGTADDMAEYLIETFRGADGEPGVQREAVLALGANASGAAVEFLGEISADNLSGQFLRVSAIEALSRIGDPRGLDAILAGVSSGEPHVRAASVQALGPFSGAAVDEAILEAFRDSHEATRIAAARASRERVLVAAVPYLRFRATRDESLTVREHAIRALGAIGGFEATETVEEIFSERRGNARLRIVAAEVLMEINANAYIERLVEEMDEARRANLTALYNGFLGIVGGAVSGGMEDIARRLLGERGISERSQAIEIIANNSLFGLAEELRALAEDSNAALARRAQRALERMGLY